MNTHIKKILAISLCLVMCLSALPMLAPSASAAGEGTTYTWTAASDGHYGSTYNPNGERQDALINNILADGAARHFDIGDVSQTGPASHYPAVKAKYDGMDIPYHIVLGNHDNQANLLSTFETTAYYTIEDGDYVWIVLRSNEMYKCMSTLQLAYMEAQLERYHDKLCFVIMHVPQIKLQPGIGLSDVDNDRFISAVESHSDHIGAVLFGHIHTPTLTTINGVNYVNTGTCGSGNDNPLGMYGYMLFEIATSGATHTISVKYKDAATGTPISGYATSWTVTTGASVDRPTYIWDGEGADNLASNPLNWYQDIGGVITNDLLPTSNSMVVFDGSDNVVWDLGSVAPYSFDTRSTYSGKLEITTNLCIGAGGYLQQGGSIYQSAPVTVEGHTILGDGVLYGNTQQEWTAHGHFIGYESQDRYVKNTLNLVMAGEDTLLALAASIYSLTVTGTTTSTELSSPYMTNLDVSGHLTIDQGGFNKRCFDDGRYANSGMIDGDGYLAFVLYNSDGYLPSDMGIISCPVWVKVSFDATGNWTMTATGDIIVQGEFIVMTDNLKPGVDKTIALNLAGYNLTAAGILVGKGGILQGGSSTITNHGPWDSSNGTWVAGTSIVRQVQEKITLGTAQTFSVLEIMAENEGARWAIDGGTTDRISWTISGLYPGWEYELWVMGDHVPDLTHVTNILADDLGQIKMHREDGGMTSYALVPVGTLPIDDDPDAGGADGIWQYGTYVLGLIGALALAVYAIGVRHPLVLIVGIALVVIAALLHLGVI